MAETVVFRSYDGLPLYGTFLAGKSEVVGAALLVHGTVSDREELGFYTDMANFLSLEGFSSLRFDYRCNGVDKTPQPEMTLSGILNDIDAAFRFLQSKLGEKVPIYLVGTSFGGGLSAFWASQNPGLVETIFLNAPLLDYEDEILKRPGLLESAGVNLLGQEMIAKMGFVETSGFRFGKALIEELPTINGIRPLQNPPCKVIIFHGDLDADVPISSSKKYVSSDVRLIVVPGTEHGFGIPGDEDLTHPTTKENHRKIYKTMVGVMKGGRLNGKEI